jgi:hypothetical protein
VPERECVASVTFGLGCESTLTRMSSAEAMYTIDSDLIKARRSCTWSCCP